MDRKNALIGLIAVGLLLAIALASNTPKPTTQKCPGGVCPTCPGGVCPVEYQALERYYTSQSQPQVDIPVVWREKNYSGGSCVHATTETLLRWAGHYELADWWRDNYAGGESAYPHERKMQEAGLKYVMTTDGDTRLLEWAIATRRGAGIGWPTMHCTALVGHKDGYAIIEDNNHIDRYTRVPWDEFVGQWKGMGGWAFVLVYNPPPPVPTH